MAFVKDYETVATRIDKFYKDYPNGRISTILFHFTEEFYIVRAEVYRDINDDVFAASGLAEEYVAEKGVNEKSALENCETSAIGRALANLNYATKNVERPSHEEMNKNPRPRPKQIAANKPKPVATDEQIANWKLELAAAADQESLKIIGMVMSTHAISDVARTELLDIWTARQQELA